VVQSQVPAVPSEHGGGDRKPRPSSLGCRGHSCSVTWVDGGGEEAVCFLVDTVDGARLRALGEAEDLPGLFIHPVIQVGHAVATLGAQVILKVEYHLERVLSSPTTTSSTSGGRNFGAARSWVRTRSRGRSSSTRSLRDRPVPQFTGGGGASRRG